MTMIMSPFQIAVWLTVADARAADCPKPVAPADWGAHLDAAERAFSSLDEVSFDRTMEEAGLDLACLSAPLSPAQAARYHRLVGLRLYVRDDEASASLAFAAARAGRSSPTSWRSAATWRRATRSRRIRRLCSPLHG